MKYYTDKPRLYSTHCVPCPILSPVTNSDSFDLHNNSMKWMLLFSPVLTKAQKPNEKVPVVAEQGFKFCIMTLESFHNHPALAVRIRIEAVMR